MSEEAETPQQRQARIRQQKREAKIKSNAQERLDKITSMGGRTPESIRNASPLATPPVSQSPTPARMGDVASPLPPSSLFGQPSDPEQSRLQEEYMRLLLGGGQPGQAGPGQQQPGMPNEDDPMIKMMQTMLGGLSGDPNAPGAGDAPSFSADDISKMTGMPSFLTSMLMGGKPQAPPTPAQVKSQRIWKILRALVSVMIGLYTVFTIDRSVATFGSNPPTPATAQNPFTIFLMGELLLNGAKAVLAGGPAPQTGFKSYTQPVRDIASDGAILLFVVGSYIWWKGVT